MAGWQRGPLVSPLIVHSGATGPEPGCDQTPERPPSDEPGSDPSELMNSRTRPIVRTMAALLSVQGITWISTLAGILVIPRFLGASGLGIFASAGAVAGIVRLGAGLGMSNELVRRVARSPGKAADYIAHATAVRLALWAPAMAIGLVVVLTRVDDFIIGAVIVSTLLGAGVALVGDAATAGLQGNQTFARAALVGGVVGLATQATTITVLMLGGGLIGLCLVGLVSSVAAAAVSVFLFWRRLGRPVQWSTGVAREVARAGLPFLAWELALQVYGSIDYVLLAWMTNSRTVGEYAFAYRLAGIPVFAATIVTTAIYPSLAATARRDPEFFRRVLTHGSRAVLVVTLPMATGLAVLAPQFTRLVGGRGFDSAGPLLAIVSVHVPLVSMNTVLGVGMFALDRQRRMALAGFIAAILNPAANLIAIPLSVHLWGDGAIGSSIVTVATECFMGTWIWIALAQHLDWPQLLSSGGRALAVCVVMGVVVRLAQPEIGTLGAVPLGALIWVAGGLAVKLVSPDDARKLRTAFASG